MGNFVAFTTSWDDGSPSDTRVADLLHSFGLLGTFYASTGPEGARSISDSDLRRIAQDHELGNHGRTHTPFLSLSSTDIEDEVRWGDRELSRFGSPGRDRRAPEGQDGLPRGEDASGARLSRAERACPRHTKPSGHVVRALLTVLPPHVVGDHTQYGSSPAAPSSATIAYLGPRRGLPATNP